jgi:hypothetical protein
LAADYCSIGRRKPLSIALRRRCSGVACEGADHGRSLYIGDFGACRLGDRRAHHRLHNLAQPAIPGSGGHDRARPRAPRRSDQDFIIAASKTYGDALVNSEPKMPELVDLYAMVSRMRALGMSKTTTCADVVMRAIVDTYYAPNRTVADLRELTRSGQGIDPLKDFSEAARQELRAFAML